MQYKIYKLQNLIDGKIYIGKTKRSLSVRLKDHIHQSSCRYLHNALNKYGLDSFSKCVIYETDSEADVCCKEKEFILQYNSLSPNGYNIVLDTDQGRTFHVNTLKLMSNNVQGTNRTNKFLSVYIGVRRQRDVSTYSARITMDKKTYVSYYPSEVLAAEAYDKVALYLYGLNARINFPSNLDKYRLIDLKKFFDAFCKKHKKTSNYVGISYAPYIKVNKWRAVVYENKRQINIGCFKTEKEAYEARNKYVEKTKKTGTPI